MHQDSVEAIKKHPLYAELVAKRKRFAWILTIIMLVIYYGFILVIAFAKQVLAIPLAAGMTTTVGIPVGVADHPERLRPDRDLCPPGQR